MSTAYHEAIRATPLDPDEQLCTLYGPEAVLMAGPDEARVLVRASILLGWGVDAADVVAVLATWAAQHPEMIGTAPEPNPWAAALAATATPACGVALQYLTHGGAVTMLGQCIRPRGHDGRHEGGPF